MMLITSVILMMALVLFELLTIACSSLAALPSLVLRSVYRQGDAPDIRSIEQVRQLLANKTGAVKKG